MSRLDGLLIMTVKVDTEKLIISILHVVASSCIVLSGTIASYFFFFFSFTTPKFGFKNPSSSTTAEGTADSIECEFFGISG